MKNDTLHREVNFEEYITRQLAKKDGWVVSNDDTGFDANTALVFDDFVEYLSKTQPETLKKMQTKNPSNWRSNLEKDLVKYLENKGTVSVLRDGINVVGYPKIDCSGHFPDDPRLEKQKALYDANILRVMRQVHYQTAGNKSLDLVFFINGIAVATAEVKTEMTQTVHDAVLEYQTERKPIEPDTRRKNYLLMYKRGAIVHFAISEDEIYMCTNLEPDRPKFLPFNMGNDGKAGNPKAPKGKAYPTWYFWDIICQKDNWLKIFQNFIYEEVKKKEDATGRNREVKTQIFPRFHQFNCVTKCINDVKENGVGQKYLIEHSAGSGKTATISWIAHELIRLRDNEGKKIYSSVIVVTNRKVLDNNIKANIKQLKKMPGLIASIGGDEAKKTNGAKSKELAKALEEQREIIVVTLQTFPYALEAISTNKKLEGRNFAILIDEAHSGQSGNDAGKMKAALKLATAQKKAEHDNTDVSTEELINAYFREMQEAREMPENVSFFAFTATPKAETKTLFGRPSDEKDKDGNPIPKSFDLYPMRQAIEEGYILDVLEGYMPYETAYRLKEDIVPDTMVDTSTALRTIAHWQTLHPTNVMAKSEFIIEHFVKNVAPMLNGEAKAMIVTASRASVVRYKYAIEAYLKTHPEYDASKLAANLQFKVPGEPLVAFSGTVHGKDAIMPEDEEVVDEFDYLKENPFAQIKKDYDYTEASMNEIGNQRIEDAFDTDRKRRLLIVADKFQTGFDQPKLCAMYIDKKIANDIEIVQTYSRLNRTCSGKDKVFIVDFVNDQETVYRAFKKYDKGAEMEQAQKLDIIFDIKDDLESAGIFTSEEFENFKVVKYKSLSAIEANKDTYRKKLYDSVSAPAERWNEAYKAETNAYATWKNVEKTAKEAGNKEHAKRATQELEAIQERIDVLTDFRKKLKRYISAYDFISQIIYLDNPDLEVFYSFVKLLSSRINGIPLEDIDVRVLVLADFKLNKLDKPDPDEVDGGVLRPMGNGKGRSKANEKQSLKEIVAKINEIWGSEVDVSTGARTLNAIYDIVNADDVSRIQIRNSTNSKDSVIAEGRLEGIIKSAAATLKQNDFSELCDKLLKDKQTWKPIAEVIFDMVNEKKHIDVSDLVKYANTNKKKK